MTDPQPVYIAPRQVESVEYMMDDPRYTIMVTVGRKSVTLVQWLAAGKQVDWLLRNVGAKP